MGKNEILAKLNDIFRDAFGRDDLEVGLETTAADVPGWDSLMQINLVGMIEREFHISFGMDELVSMASVGEIVGIIEGKLR